MMMKKMTRRTCPRTTSVARMSTIMKMQSGLVIVVEALCTDNFIGVTHDVTIAVKDRS
jgi:hypothetical protein